MKHFVLILSLLSVISAHASDDDVTLHKCKVASISDSSFFENLLTARINNEVEIFKTDSYLGVRFGYHYFGSHPEDKINKMRTAKNVSSYMIKLASKIEQYQLIIDNKVEKQNGKLMGRMRESRNAAYGKWVLVAKLRCK